MVDGQRHAAVDTFEALEDLLWMAGKVYRSGDGGVNCYIWLHRLLYQPIGFENRARGKAQYLSVVRMKQVYKTCRGEDQDEILNIIAEPTYDQSGNGANEALVQTKTICFPLT
jgi:hypothetical protein